MTSFGSQELRKDARSKSLAEMKLQAELTRLRNTQNDRKVKTKCELSLQFNMAVDKETELLVNPAEIEDEKDKPLSADQLRSLKEVDASTVNRLRGLQEELECIKYISLSSNPRGGGPPPHPWASRVASPPHPKSSPRPGAPHPKSSPYKISCVACTRF